MVQPCLKNGHAMVDSSAWFGAAARRKVRLLLHQRLVEFEPRSLETNAAGDERGIADIFYYTCLDFIS